jgi:hypothetical protein
MEPAQWLASFNVLHDQNRRGGLNPSEKKKYLQMRDELARSLMQSQNLTVPTNVAPRRALGVAQLFSIELQNVHRVMTRELSCTGYVALVPATFGVGELVTFTLTLGRSIELVKGDSVVKQISKQGTNYRVVADFKGLMEPALERIEDAVFDAALSRLK